MRMSSGSDDINAKLVCRTPPGKDDVAKDDAYRRCAFGQWLYSSPAAKVVSRTQFAELEDEHKAVHRYAAAWLRNAQDGPADHPRRI